MKAEKKLEEKERSPKKEFDPDLLPDNIHNREAAQERNWRYKPSVGYYVDDEGALMADHFGQPL